MTHDELREAVARTLCLQFYGTEWDVTSVFRRTICFGMADAALAVVREALREPTSEMWEEGSRWITPKHIWPAMLAASALGGGDE